MKEKLEKFDSFLNQLELKRVENGIGGGKLLIVGIESSKMELKLSLTYHDNVFIEKFNGSIESVEFTKLVTKIVEQIKLLGL